MEDLGLKDRRIFLRFPVSLPVRYVNLNLKRKSQAQTVNISANGIGILTNEELIPHTILDIWLHIPENGQPLYTKGEVIWSKQINGHKYRVGICLKKVELMALSRVLNLINRTQGMAGEKSQKIKRHLLARCLAILKLIRLRF